jgi:hypothetical protein
MGICEKELNHLICRSLVVLENKVSEKERRDVGWKNVMMAYLLVLCGVTNGEKRGILISSVDPRKKCATWPSVFSKHVINDDSRDPNTTHSNSQSHLIQPEFTTTS